MLDSPSLDLSLKGSVNLDKAIEWVPPPPVPVTGMATIEGTITGPARNFALDLAVHSNTLDVGRERELGLAGSDPRHVRRVLRARPGDLAAIGRIDSRQVQRAVGQGVDQHRRARSGAASTRKRRCGWPTSTRRRSAARFEGHGTFEFSEPRKLRDSRTARPGARAAASVPMTGTINATIVGDDYRFDHDNSFPGFELEGKMYGRIKRGAALLSTMNGPAHARVSDVGQAARSARARSASRSPTSCSRRTARSMRR